MLINDVKIKILFNNNAKMNCMLKKLINAIQLFIRQEINIAMINFTDERTCFFNVCKSIFINIESIIISIFIFVIERSNYKFLLKYCFQRIARINAVNINNDLLKMMLHLLNDEKRMSFLKVFAEHFNNKDEKFVFVFKTLNI